MTLEERISKIVSEILSDRYEAKIKVVFKEAEPNVQNMPTDTMPESVSQCNASDCA